MWPVWILVLMVTMSGYMIMSQEAKTPAMNLLRSEALAGNMAVYRGSVMDYVIANPTFVGTVTDADLTFPAWGYNRNPLWTNRVTGGTVVIYPTALPPINITADIVKLSKNSFYAGEANTVTNTVFSPLFGDTNIPIPAGVPSGAPVWAGRIN